MQGENVIMPTTTNTIKIGDTVIEPTIGICKVTGIRQMVVDNQQEDYFIFEGPNAQVMVPRSQIKKRGIRKPMDADAIKKVNTALKTPVNPTRGDARTQYLEYQEILKSGDPTRISKLLRQLFILEQTDDLKGKERELMEKARQFLIEEITFIQGDSKTKVGNDINEHLKSMYKKKAKKDKEAARASAKA